MPARCPSVERAVERMWEARIGITGNRRESPDPPLTPNMDACAAGPVREFWPPPMPAASEAPTAAPPPPPACARSARSGCGEAPSGAARARGKLPAVALEDPSKSVEFATGPDRFQLPFMGAGPPLPRACAGLSTPPASGGRRIGRVADRASRIRHAAGLADVRQCSQRENDMPGKTAVKCRLKRPSRPSPNTYSYAISDSRPFGV